MIIMSYVSTGTRSTNPRNAWVCPVCPDVARRQPPADRRPRDAVRDQQAGQIGGPPFRARRRRMRCERVTKRARPPDTS